MNETTEASDYGDVVGESPVETESQTRLQQDGYQDVIQHIHLERGGVSRGLRVAQGGVAMEGGNQATSLNFDTQTVGSEVKNLAELYDNEEEEVIEKALSEDVANASFQ